MKTTAQSNTWRWGLIGTTAVLLYALVLWNDRRLPGLLAGQAPHAADPPTKTTAEATPPAPRNTQSPTPTGKGVPTGHVEGSWGDYLPNLKAADFDGVRMVPRSGTSKVNGHSHATARAIYGRTGLAPGIDEVYFYTTADWMRRLRQSTALPPDHDGRRLFTHSWIGQAQTASASNALRRIDYLIDTQDVMMVVGVNNGRATPIPPLLASSYNSVAVGVASGNSSGGYTVYEGTGRCKPDIVANRRTTSDATPVVASMVARLLEAAGQMPTADAGRSEVIKAVLLAGATKPDGWEPQAGKPLDEHLGAGLANFHYSYAILQAGPCQRDHLKSSYGWSFQTIPRGASHAYGFNLTHPMVQASVVLVWHRHIDGRQAKDLLSGEEKWLDYPRLADLDLRLIREHPSGQSVSIAQSASRIDNTEHLYLPSLPPGRYRFEVIRQDRLREDWGYALAWRMQRATDPEARSPAVVPRTDSSP